MALFILGNLGLRWTVFCSHVVVVESGVEVGASVVLFQPLRSDHTSPRLRHDRREKRNKRLRKKLAWRQECFYYLRY